MTTYRIRYDKSSKKYLVMACREKSQPIIIGRHRRHNDAEAQVRLKNTEQAALFA